MKVGLGDPAENAIDGFDIRTPGHSWRGGSKLLIEYNHLVEIFSMAAYSGNVYVGWFESCTIYYSKDDSLTLNSNLSNFSSFNLNSGSKQELAKSIHVKRVLLSMPSGMSLDEFECYGRY